MYARTFTASVALATICVPCEWCLIAAPAQAVDENADSKQEVTIAVGDPAPELCLMNCDGNSVAPEDSKGKHLLVVYWSLDDPKRDDLIRQLRQIRQHYLRDDRLRIFSVCMDDDWERWITFLNKQDELPGKEGGLIPFWSDAKWWQLFHYEQGWNEQVGKASQFHGDKTPALFLIGPNGRFLAVDIPTDKLASVLTEKLNAKAD